MTQQIIEPVYDPRSGYLDIETDTWVSYDDMGAL